MKNIVIDNVPFPIDLAYGVLKLKYETSPFPELQDKWDELKPHSFSDIADMKNIEMRRVAMLHFGLERLVNQINPILIDRKVIKKTVKWVDDDGVVTTKTIDDTYLLYEVDGDVLGINQFDKCHYVQCKDTSTDREYLIWVDSKSVLAANNNTRYETSKLTATAAIAWTFQTDVKEGDIEQIIRQGDCIMIKPKSGYVPMNNPRHLTEKEYLELLVNES